MVEATQSYPDLPSGTKHAVMTLARYAAKEAVKQAFQVKGYKTAIRPSGGVGPCDRPNGCIKTHFGGVFLVNGTQHRLGAVAHAVKLVRGPEGDHPRA